MKDEVGMCTWALITAFCLMVFIGARDAKAQILQEYKPEAVIGEDLLLWKTDKGYLVCHHKEEGWVCSPVSPVPLPGTCIKEPGNDTPIICGNLLPEEKIS